MRRIDYDYDELQNLAKRVIYDDKGQVSFYEKFTYDVLYRITSASTYQQKKDNQNQFYRELIESSIWKYDRMGNILSFDETTDTNKTYKYKYDSKVRQQAVQIGNETVEYDALGNVKKTDAYKIDWYSFSKARSITTLSAADSSGHKNKNSVITFTYGPERELTAKYIEKIKDDDASTLKTKIHFVDDFYERWTITNGSSTKIVHKYHVRVLGRIVSTRIVTEPSPESSVDLEEDK